MTIPTGKTAINLKFNGGKMEWQFTVTRNESGNLTHWQFGLSHPELVEFRDGLIDLIDDVEQQAGEIIRGE